MVAGLGTIAEKAFKPWWLLCWKVSSTALYCGNQNNALMEEPIFPSTITARLYTEGSILLATFLGGPLAGGYLIAQNFKAIDEPARVGRTWLVTGLVFLFIIATGFIPVLDKLPVPVYSFVFCMAAHSFAKKYQGSKIRLHQENGGFVYGRGRATLIGLASMLLMLALVVVGFYLQDSVVSGR